MGDCRWGAERGRAKAFIQFASRSERITDQTNYIAYGPVRRSAAETIAPGIRDNMPTTPANFTTAIQNDFEFWTDHGDELAQRFSSGLLAN